MRTFEPESPACRGGASPHPATRQAACQSGAWWRPLESGFILVVDALATVEAGADNRRPWRPIGDTWRQGDVRPETPEVGTFGPTTSDGTKVKWGLLEWRRAP